MRRLSLVVLVALMVGTLPAAAGDRPASPRKAEGSPAVLSLLWGSFLDLLSPRSLVEALGADMDPFGRLSPTTAPAPPPAGSSTPVVPEEQLGADMDPFG